MSTAKKRAFEEHQDGNGNGNEDKSSANEVFISEPILDRSSTFIAHFHPLANSQASSTGQTAKDKSLTSTVKGFQTHPDFAAADHRMVAWRRPSAQRTLGLGLAASSAGVGKTICTTGSDDDGEKYAGKRLERVLIDLDVQGTIVVARWYGGILLGPVRFTHIENAAREAIGKWKSKSKQRQQAETTERQAKRQKTAGPGGGDEDEDEAQLAAERARLARQLAERDNSIIVLRGLLAEKTAKHQPDVLQDGAGAGAVASQGTPVQATTASSTSSSQSSPAKKMEYSEMPLQRLRQLDKARDATIAFILKQIDKAEEEEKKKEKENKQEGSSEVQD
ncbi:hypothetical protein LTR41_001680 [Exophiala xenobiotica]|nr:hypothetical protein LTR41_001680 [Exophiala xenobiotica]